MLTRCLALLLFVPVAYTLTVSAGYPADAVVAHVRAQPAYARALDSLTAGFPAFVDDVIELTEIPAPPFEEDARGARFLTRLREAGLTDVERDEEGNVMGIRRGGGGPMVCLSAHLDTVFPPGTDVTIHRSGTRLSAPGVGDDSHALAMLLAVARALADADIRTSHDILFVGTVGEEAGGSLRGAHYLFERGRYRDRIGRFVSIDGVGPRSLIINGGVGSARYRVTFTGPGGHSYGSFGLVNPAYALADAVHRISTLHVRGSERTTFNVGRMGGGTSVNSIPSETWMEVDLRSESADRLDMLVDIFTSAMEAAADTENDLRSTLEGPIAVNIELLGTRPAGETSAGSPLVTTAAAVTRLLGAEPEFLAGSTDANLPMSLGVQAIAIDSGFGGARAHAPDEWLDVDPKTGLAGLERALLLTLSLAGLE